MTQKRWKPLLILLFLPLMYLQAQDLPFNISGLVSDEQGEPLIGAGITVEKSGQGTVTNLNGKFELTVSPNDFLKITYLGYETQRIKVSKQQNLRIFLKEDVQSLDEVVVTALGISREAKSLSYARQSVDTRSMVENRDASLLNMLAGKVAGLQLISAGGPLSSTRVVIRGNNYLTGDNQPVYVVDGIIINNSMGSSGDLDYGNAANNINPDDIESMEILKGANASALYGSQAANGVILITTKKGSKKAGLGVSYAYNMTFSHLYQYPTMQNIYGAGIDNRWYNGNNVYGATGGGASFNPDLPYGMYSMPLANVTNWSWGMPMLGFDIVGRNGEIKQYSPSPGTIADMYKTGKAITNSVSVDRAFNETSSMRFSYTHIHADDILENFNIVNRHSFNLRSVSGLAKFLTLDVGVKYVYEDVNNRGYRNGSDRNPLWIIANLPRDVTVGELTPWKNPDGTALSRGSFINPYWVLNELSNGDNSHWLLGNASLNFKFSNLLSLRLSAATDIQFRKNWRFDNVYTPFNIDGEYETGMGTTVNNNFDGIFSYNQALSEKIRIGANAGAILQKMNGESLRARAESLLQANGKSLAYSVGESKPFPGYGGKEKQSVFGAVNFSYGNWLFLDATARNEWSSTLPINGNSYFYYSFGAGIILTDLIPFKSSILTFAKLRASNALVGNDAQFDYLFNGYNRSGETFLGNTYFVSETTRKNTTLKPEKTVSREAGLDLRFFDRRLTVDATYYWKSTTNQIINANISKISGFNSKIFNAGEIQNKGVELTFGITPIRSRDFNWTMNINWAMNRSLVVSLADDITRLQMDDGEYDTKLYIEVGKPYGVIYGNDYRKNEEGQIYVDLTGRPFTESDQYLGCVEPDFMGGVRNSFSYRDFDFNLMFDFKRGGVLWSRTATMGGNYGQTIQSLDGRDDNFFSTLILGENGDEQRGFLSPGNTVTPGANFGENAVLYPDGARPKGVIMENTVYGPDVDYWAGQPSMAWVRPIEQWTHNASSNTARYMFDASYIKLREISLGYNVPRTILAKTPFSSARLSAVGRNVAILFQNTPKGIDPEATSSVGNAQGLEKGFALPSASWGFDLKVSF
jgi:TonB-linked SusC/RagA family outer membrane protein